MTIQFSFAILALLSVPICGQAERILAKEDPGGYFGRIRCPTVGFYRNPFEFSLKIRF